MDEGLGQVSAQLSLGDVELLGEEPWRSARAPGAFEPSRRLDRVALFEVGA